MYLASITVGCTVRCTDFCYPIVTLQESTDYSSNVLFEVIIGMNQHFMMKFIVVTLLRNGEGLKKRVHPTVRPTDFRLFARKILQIEFVSVYLMLKPQKPNYLHR